MKALVEKDHVRIWLCKESLEKYLIVVQIDVVKQVEKQKYSSNLQNDKSLLEYYILTSINCKSHVKKIAEFGKKIKINGQTN